MSEYILSEHDGCKRLYAGDKVMATPLYSCCLIVMRMESGRIYAEHCGGTDLDTLSPDFFSETAVEALMLTSRESAHQTAQAHALQLKLPAALLKYYASDRDNGSTPRVRVEPDGSLFLEPLETYHFVNY